MSKKEEMRKVYDLIVSKGVFYCPNCGVVSDMCKEKRLQELEIKKKGKDPYGRKVDRGETCCHEYVWEDIDEWTELECGCKLKKSAEHYLVYRQGFVYVCRTELDHKKVMNALDRYISDTEVR